MKLPVPLLRSSDPFPDPATANRDGLVAITMNLTTERLLEAYSKGIFPWTENPVTWWSPDPRGILPLAQLHVPRRLERTLRSGKFRFTVNQAFGEVIRGCAEPSPGREQSWIGPAFIKAYTGLHQRGHATSFEAWQDERLIGGLYGVKIGNFFAGESMFHGVRDASSAVLVFAVRTLREQGCRLFDLQMVTSHTARFGAVEVTRADYLKILNCALREGGLSEPASYNHPALKLQRGGLGTARPTGIQLLPFHPCGIRMSKGLTRRTIVGLNHTSVAL